MADKNWVGLFTGTQAWNTGSNWSGGTVPAGGQTVLIGASSTAVLTVNVATTAIPAIAGLELGTPSQSTALTTSFAVGTAAWNVGSGTVPLVCNGPTFLQTGLTGSAKLVKSGNGYLAINSNRPSTGWSGGMDITSGDLIIDALSPATNLGTGPYSFTNGTGFSTGSPNVSITVNNAITFAGTVTLNAYGGGTGVLNLNGTVSLTGSPNLSTARETRFNNTVSGTAGFTKSGSGVLAISDTAPQSTGLSGTVTLASTTYSDLYIGLSATNTASNNKLPNVTKYSFASGAVGSILFGGNAAYNNDSALENLASSSSFITSVNTAAVTFTDASVGTFTGCYVAQSNGVAGFLTAGLTLNTFPTAASNLYLISALASGATVHSSTITIGGTGATNNSTIYVRTTGTATAFTANLISNSSGTSVFTGSVVKDNNTGTATLSLGGTSSSSTLSGVISQSNGTLAIAKANAGKWILSGANTYTGATSISAGTLVANNNSALGAATGTVTVASGATLEIGNNISVSKGSATLSLTGSGESGTKGSLYSASGTNAYTASGITLASSAVVGVKVDADSLTLNGAISGSGSTLKHLGAGTLKLTSAANSFSTLDISSGTVEVTGALANSGNSAIGAGSTAANWLVGSTSTAGAFRWSGSASTSTSRPWTIGTAGSTVAASGTSGAVLTLSGTPSFSANATACTFTLAGTGGTADAPNVISSNLGDNGGQPVTLAKTEAGAWRASGTVTCDKVSVAGGSLGFNGNSYANNVELSGTGVLRDIVLTSGGTKAINCTSGTAEIVTKTATNNSCTAPVTVSNAGTILKLTTDMSPLTTGQGKVLGDSPVTVNAGAGLRTDASSAQRGQMRYGANVTFKAGSRLYIGG